MDLVNAMRDKLSQAGQSTAQKAKDLSELAKLNAMVSGAKKQITELYGKIGYEVCRAYSNEPLPNGRQRGKLNFAAAAAFCPSCGQKA